MEVGRVLRVVFLCALLRLSTQSEAWSYGSNDLGPAHWKTTFPQCGRKSQSPINVNSGTAIEDDKVNGFSISSTSPHDTVETLVNNGHAVTVMVTGGQFDLSGGGLPATYRLAQYHFHIGSKDSQGSEHTLDGKRFPGEMHMVFFNTKYESFSEAADKPQGLAVAAFFLKVEEDDDPLFGNVIAGLMSVKVPGKETKIERNLDVIMLPMDADSDFYRYDGSLTTPPCYESVVWTIFATPIGISENQLKSFRKVLNSDGKSLDDNFRPTQEENGRKVYKMD